MHEHIGLEADTDVFLTTHGCILNPFAAVSIRKDEQNANFIV